MWEAFSYGQKPYKVGVCVFLYMLQYEEQNSHSTIKLTRLVRPVSWSLLRGEEVHTVFQMGGEGCP